MALAYPKGALAGGCLDLRVPACPMEIARRDAADVVLPRGGQPFAHGEAGEVRLGIDALVTLEAGGRARAEHADVRLARSELEIEERGELARDLKMDFAHFQLGDEGHPEEAARRAVVKVAAIGGDEQGGAEDAGNLVPEFPFHVAVVAEDLFEPEAVRQEDGIPRLRRLGLRFGFVNLDFDFAGVDPDAVELPAPQEDAPGVEARGDVPGHDVGDGLLPLAPLEPGAPSPQGARPADRLVTGGAEVQAFQRLGGDGRTEGVAGEIRSEPEVVEREDGGGEEARTSQEYEETAVKPFAGEEGGHGFRAAGLPARAVPTLAYPAFSCSSTSGSRTSAHSPCSSSARTNRPLCARLRMASVSSYSPRGATFRGWR